MKFQHLNVGPLKFPRWDLPVVDPELPASGGALAPTAHNGGGLSKRLAQTEAPPPLLAFALVLLLGLLDLDLRIHPFHTFQFFNPAKKVGEDEKLNPPI